MERKMFEEMKPIPGYPKYLMRKDGAVFNRQTGHKLNSYAAPGRMMQYYTLYQNGNKVNRSERVLYELAYGDSRREREDRDGLWRVIKEFPDYEMSDRGFVRRRLTKQVIRPQIGPKGDIWIRLSKDGRRLKRSEHHLMEETFPEIAENL